MLRLLIVLWSARAAPISSLVTSACPAEYKYDYPENVELYESLKTREKVFTPLAPDWISINQPLIDHELANHRFGFIVGCPHSGAPEDCCICVSE